MSTTHHGTATAPASSSSTTPRTWTLLFVCLAQWMVQFGGGFFVAIVVSNAFPEFDRAELLLLLQTPPYFALILFVITVGGLCIALGAALLSPTPWRTRLNLEKRPTFAPLWALFLAATGVTYVWGSALDFIWRWFVDDTEHVNPIDAMLSAASPLTWVSIVVLVVVVAPLAEECLFRGYLQSRLTARWGLKVGIVLPSLLFAVGHIDPQHILALLPMGFMLAWVTHRSGTIRPAIIMHMMHNLFLVLLHIALD